MQHHHARTAYKDHQFAHSALDVQDICALNSDHAALNSERWQQDVGAIIVDDLTDLIQSFKQDGVELGVCDHDGFHEHLGRHDKIVETLLRTQNAFRGFTRDVDKIIGSPLSAGRRVAKQTRKWRWEVDGGPGGRLDHLDVLAPTAADKRVHSQLELHCIHVALQL